MPVKYFLIFVVLTYHTCDSQFIMGPKEFCQFHLNGKEIQVTSELSVISAKYHQLTIALSPCVHFSKLPSFSKNQKRIGNCPSYSKACIITENSVINAGNKFIYTEILDEESQRKEKVLVSINGDECTNNKKYSVIIHFNCNRIKPSYNPPIEDEDIAADPCTYHIEMIGPNCTPHCIVRIANQFLNIKDLATIPDIIVPIEGNRRAVLSMCRASVACNSTNNTVACEIQTDTLKGGNDSIISPLGTLSTEKSLWNDEKQQLYLRSQVGIGKKNRRVTEIRLICNWNANSVSNTRIIKNSNKMIVFEVESKFGCVKTPPNCEFKSSQQFSYNLQNLYKIDNWLLSNTSIALNICGSLKLPQRNRSCQKSYSQICDKAANVNYGSIMLPIKVDPFDDFLSATFVGGSVCASNTSLYYSTNIKFVCSLINVEPKFINVDKCTINILWETSEACPFYISSGQNCKVPISSIYSTKGELDLNDLHTSIDRTIVLSNNLTLIYNFCGKLASACNNTADVSMCLVYKNKQSVLGLENNDVIFENGVIRSYFYNDFNFDADKPNVNVSFICNHNKLKEGVVSVYSLNDKIAYQMTVETPLACYTNITYDCTYTHENQLYDLSPLMRNDSNYEISTDQFRFHINICRPALINSQSLCSSDSLACLTNLTEANVSKRFFSLGRKQKIDFDKGLILKYTFGSLCPNSRSFAMETTIRFSCSMNKETGPILIESNKCNHTITWATKFACPKKAPFQKRSEKECLVQLADKIIYNFTSLKKYDIEITLKDNITIKLNICNGLHSFKNSEDVRTKVATRIFHEKKDNSYLEFDLMNNYTVKINFQCDYDQNSGEFEFNPDIETDSVDENTFNIVLRSREVCTKNIANTTSSTIAPVIVSQFEFKTPHVSPTNFKQLLHPPKNNTKRNCSITSSWFGTFSLNTLPPIYVQSEKHSYYIDFNNTVNCNSYVCKDNAPFVHRNNSDCPKYELDGENLSIKFALINESICRDKDLKGVVLSLECGEKKNPAVRQESDCYVEINYRAALICSFSNNLALITNTEVSDKYKLGGVIVVCLLVAIILIFTILRYFHKKRRAMLPTVCGNIEFTSLVKQDISSRSRFF